MQQNFKLAKVFTIAKKAQKLKTGAVF